MTNKLENIRRENRWKAMTILEEFKRGVEKIIWKCFN